MFPVPEDHSSEVNLDVSHMGLLDLEMLSDDGYVPDVLVLPSVLKQFHRVSICTTSAALI